MTKPVEIDTRAALQRLGGDGELLIHLIDMIREDSGVLLQGVTSALEAGDFLEVERALHSLRGLVSNVGCESIREQALEMEDFARRGDRSSVATALPVLRETVSALLNKLAEARGEIDPSK